MRKYDIKNNDLIYKNKTIKTLDAEEIDATNIIIDILNQFELECSDTKQGEPYFIADNQLIKSGCTEDEIKTALKILLIDDNYHLHETLKTQKIDEFLNIIEETDLNIILDLDQYLESIDEMKQIPDKLISYIDYDKILSEDEINGDINTWKIYNRSITDLALGRVLIQTYLLNDFFYEIGLKS